MVGSWVPLTSMTAPTVAVGGTQSWLVTVLAVKVVSGSAVCYGTDKSRQAASVH